MAKAPQLSVTKRTLTGRKVKLLRRQHQIPANIFGKKITSTPITLDSLVFKKLFQSAGETTLLELNLEGETKPRPVLIASVQHHPVTGEFIHVDFHQVDLTEKVTAKVPLEFVGESPAVKEQGGVLVHVISEIEVEALPAELPDSFKVDLSALKAIGDSLTLAELKLDRSKVTIDLDDSETIVTIQAPKEEEVEEVAPTPAEAEVTGQTPTPAEGETPVEAKAEPEKKS
jgi:large subunit ribosomal protein L25